MKNRYLTFLIMVSLNITMTAQGDFKKSLVDYDAFEVLVKDVKEHRQDRLITVNDFLKNNEKSNFIILDTRSKIMYDRKHIKGAIHLNFSDFNQYSLKELIPNLDTKILIYCNNNIEDDPISFVTKSVLPKVAERNLTKLTLALNIPTYINLYGYGYRNVYELSELISVNDIRISFESNNN